MEFSDVIKKRGSFRGPFTGEKIPRQELQNIVEAGIAAPSGCNAQTTSFVIVDDEQLVRQIAAITGKDYINQAGAVIVVVADQTPAYGSMSFYKEDAAAATENILLAIADGGWASVWLDGILRVGGIAEKIAAMPAAKSAFFYYLNGGQAGNRFTRESTDGRDYNHRTEGLLEASRLSEPSMEAL